MKFISIRSILFFVFICSITCSYSQNTLRLKKGEVIDSLKVPSSKGIYSIYLPKSFDLNSGWPVLFGFDSARNQNALTNTFKKSAEEFGYIVVVSDYGESLSSEDKSSYISLFIKHIVSLFPIQNKRMYVFGTGKDAPLNTSLPLLYEQFEGVIAIGNSYNYSQKLNRNNYFSYVGMVGNKNFRSLDFEDTNKYLRKKGAVSEVYVFNGNEELPPPNIIAKALPHFTMAAMAKGTIPKDSIWIENRYQKDRELVSLLKEEKKYLQAYDELTKMRSRYRLFLNVDNLKEEQKEIRKVDDYKKERRLRSKYQNQEIFLRQSLFFSMEEDIELNQYGNLGWWQYKIGELEKIHKNKEIYASNMVIRIKGFLKNVLSDYKKEVINYKKEEDRKIFLNILSTIVDKNDFESYRNIISLSTIDNDNETALFYLEKMLQQGYKDIDKLYAIEGTLALRVSKEYNGIIKQYLGTSKYFNFD
ncbi:hypothetical protein SAMN04487910_3270 [Aquimarina amphilecti]|uniref:Alpha/beta hydrolase n=1 Tax=Aquimarina amphilecti TaxID=1038014 RepID=A0A1H7T308_AQUAM|nr:hypothetical protein [Aquimarina amphilecti]SEL79280.1 hypothetical protein SAMN04487910_3270 [Aquimarina amphilecti]